MVGRWFLRIEVRAQRPDAALKARYDSHRWFALREAVAKGEIAPASFYKAAVETAFHQDERAKIDVKQYIASHPAWTCWWKHGNFCLAWSTGAHIIKPRFLRLNKFSPSSLMRRTLPTFFPLSSC